MLCATSLCAAIDQINAVTMPEKTPDTTQEEQQHQEYSGFSDPRLAFLPMGAMPAVGNRDPRKDEKTGKHRETSKPTSPRIPSD